VIIYGNTEGVRVVWYGGKSFQASQSTTTKSKINGTNKDEPMVIDLDDDEPSAKDILAEEAEFEEEEEEVDTAQPYRNILRFLDVMGWDGMGWDGAAQGAYILLVVLRGIWWN
jgi:hypothetical protein